MAILREEGDSAAEQSVAELHRMLLALTPPPAPLPLADQARADVLLARGVRASDLDLLSQSLGLYRQARDRWGEAYALQAIGEVHVGLSHEDQALESFEAAVAIHRSLGAWLGEWMTLSRAFDVHQRRGDDLERRYEQQKDAILGDVGYIRAEAADLVRYWHGTFDRRSVDGLERALVAFREVGDGLAERAVLYQLRVAQPVLAEASRALEPLEWAVAAYRQAGNRQAEARMLNELGRAYSDRGINDFRQAIRNHEQALALFRAVGDRSGESSALVELLSWYDFLSSDPRQDPSYDERLAFGEQVVAINRELGFRSGEAYGLELTADVYRSLKQPSEEVELRLQALVIRHEDGSFVEKDINRVAELYIELGEPRLAVDIYARLPAEVRNTAPILIGIGKAYIALGEHAEGLEYLARAVAELGAGSQAAEVLTTMAHTYLGLGEYALATDLVELARTWYRDAGDRDKARRAASRFAWALFESPEQGRALAYLAQISDPGSGVLDGSPFQIRLGDYSGALASLRAVLQGRDRTFVDAVLLGWIYAYLGDYTLALEHYEQALALTRYAGASRSFVEVFILKQMGSVYHTLGDYSRAFDAYQRALDTDDQTRAAYLRAMSLAGPWERVGDLGWLASVRALPLEGLGALYGSLDQYDRAIDLAGEALALAERGEFRLQEGNALITLANSYGARGDSDRAIELAGRALAVWGELRFVDGQRQSLSSLGAAHGSAGRYETALDYFEQALAIAEATDDRASQARALSDVGLARSALGQDEQALPLFQRAADLARDIGTRPGEISALADLAAAQHRLGRVDDALRSYEQAIVLIDAMQAEATNEEVRSLLVQRYKRVYERAAAVRAGLGPPREENPFREAFARGFQPVARGSIDDLLRPRRGEDFFGT